MMNQRRNASCLYAGEWGDNAPIGITVITTSDENDCGFVGNEFVIKRVVPAGTIAKVVRWSNAGFQGMLAKLLLSDGTTISNVNASDLYRC